MAVSDGLIVYEDCIRDLALKLDRVAIDRTNPAHVKSRARDQAKRARGFDSLLQRAFRSSEPLRIIILQGEQRAAVEVGWETARVRFRRLDDVEWYVHAYNDDGSFRVVRGVPPADDAEVTEADDEGTSPAVDENDSAPEQPPAPYLDQFAIPDAPEWRETTGTSVSRSAEVRRAALARAAGVCEFCGCAGFKAASGGIYLETHHVVPLAEEGPDAEWNVVAICPNDHRRAHHGEDRDALFDSLTAVLQTRYPQAREMLESLRARRAVQGAT
ncbi:HNH endonuclease signature motif containing protein [Thauera sp. WB-2]|uniref:HNH endonuclease signature motif containing protein n=1 Tax=Thauera sp. WB-2 TaxID=2897772 RepID=UPI0022DDD9A0|nr:HNH endonuclease signature motif containing protein [Thauera sp. WB-2]WBL64326.1 HNH endonuclease [Thauera sp. WB-2]